MRRIVLTMMAVVTVLMTIPVPASAGGYANPQFLVDTDWVAAHQGDKDLRILDMRNRQEEYAEGHVPGAIYLGVNRIRLALKEPGYIMPPDYEIEEMLGELGITKDTMVVAYDAQGGLNASRLFFTLDYIGHGRMALLNGGLTKWLAEGRPLSKDVRPADGAVYRAHVDTRRAVTSRWIKANLGKPDLALVDARSPEEFRGEDSRAKRAGHIPGAINIEWTQNLTKAKTFQPVEHLLALYEKAGVTRDKTVITYCQTMHRAAMTYFALRLLGYSEVLGYDRSWSEWGNDPALPVER